MDHSTLVDRKSLSEYYGGTFVMTKRMPDGACRLVEAWVRVLSWVPTGTFVLGRLGESYYYEVILGMSCSLPRPWAPSAPFHTTR